MLFSGSQSKCKHMLALLMRQHYAQQHAAGGRAGNLMVPHMHCQTRHRHACHGRPGQFCVASRIAHCSMLIYTCIVRELRHGLSLLHLASPGVPYGGRCEPLAGGSFMSSTMRAHQHDPLHCLTAQSVLLRRASASH